MGRDKRAFLITGASHVGKSTLAQALGRQGTWPVFSTDAIARHPGRPWPDPPRHVVEFYAEISDVSVFQFLKQHHENMWPFLRAKIEAQDGVSIWEGSALRPEFLAQVSDICGGALCLFASADFLRNRILRESGFDHRSDEHRLIIEKFISRTISDSGAQVAAAKLAGIECVDAADAGAIQEVERRILALLGEK